MTTTAAQMDRLLTSTATETHLLAAQALLAKDALNDAETTALAVTVAELVRRGALAL